MYQLYILCNAFYIRKVHHLLHVMKLGSHVCHTRMGLSDLQFRVMQISNTCHTSAQNVMNYLTNSSYIRHMCWGVHHGQLSIGQPPKTGNDMILYCILGLTDVFTINEDRTFLSTKPSQSSNDLHIGMQSEHETMGLKVNVCFTPIVLTPLAARTVQNYQHLRRDSPYHFVDCTSKFVSKFIFEIHITYATSFWLVCDGSA